MTILDLGVEPPTSFAKQKSKDKVMKQFAVTLEKMKVKLKQIRVKPSDL